MADEERQKFSFDESPAIMQQIDALAEREGTTRAALIRRGLRMVLFSLSAVPDYGNIPQHDEPTSK